MEGGNGADNGLKLDVVQSEDYQIQVSIGVTVKSNILKGTPRLLVFKDCDGDFICGKDTVVGTKGKG